MKIPKGIKPFLKPQQRYTTPKLGGGISYKQVTQPPFVDVKTRSTTPEQQSTNPPEQQSTFIIDDFVIPNYTDVPTGVYQLDCSGGTGDISDVDIVELNGLPVGYTIVGTNINITIDELYTDSIIRIR